ncbi:MAG: hypothetical protein WD100_14595, partial [Tistlia sp.]
PRAEGIGAGTRFIPWHEARPHSDGGSSLVLLPNEESGTAPFDCPIIQRDRTLLVLYRFPSAAWSALVGWDRPCEFAKP